MGESLFLSACHFDTALHCCALCTSLLWLNTVLCVSGACSVGQVSLVVNYDTPVSDYDISMTAQHCGTFPPPGLRTMLLGSGGKRRSSCKKGVPPNLTIEENVDCRGDEWSVSDLSFKVKGAKKVEIHVDDQRIYQV